MTEKVDPQRIEQLVGARRHPAQHRGRWDTSAGQIYILHSGYCLMAFKDLRQCPYSIALDELVRDWSEGSRWDDYPDRPVALYISPITGVLEPLALLGRLAEG